MVGSYTGYLDKPHNCQNRGVGTCARMGVCPGQYGICNSNQKCTYGCDCMDDHHQITICLAGIEFGGLLHLAVSLRASMASCHVMPC